MQFRRRDGLISAIFGLLTCGIYNIYFWYRYGEDVNVICEEDGKQTVNYVVAFLLSIVTCGIYGVYWIYMVASRLDTASKKYDVNVESPVLFTIFMQIPFLNYFYSCDVMNKFQEKYEQMYPNSNMGYRSMGYGGNGYGPNGPNVPPTNPYNGGNAQSFGAQVGSQLKSAVQDMGNGIKNSAQSAMPTCKNCGAVIPPGKNYCKRCGYPVNGPVPARPQMNSNMGMKDAFGKPEEQFGKMQQEQRAVQETQPAQGMQSSVQETQPAQGMQSSVQETQPAQDIQSAQTSQEAMLPVCPRCGKSVKSGDRFCIHCGSKIE